MNAENTHDSELKAEIATNLPTYINTLILHANEPIRREFDIVSIYKHDGTEEDIVLPLKHVLALFCAAYQDTQQFLHGQTAEDRVLRLQSFYACLKRIHGLCHTGIRHEIILLLNHVYKGINIIEDAVASIMYHLRDGINQRLDDSFLLNQWSDIKIPLCNWITEQNPSEILAIIDPTGAIKQKIQDDLTDNGINPATLQVPYHNATLTFDEFFASLSQQITFSASSKNIVLKFMTYILNTPENSIETYNHALNIAKNWIRDTFMLNSNEHKKSISGFYVVYKNLVTLHQEQNLLMIAGILEETELNEYLALCHSYIGNIIQNTSIPMLNPEISNKMQVLDQKIKKYKSDALVDPITNFFSLWCTGDSESRKPLYEFFTDERNHPKFLLNDFMLETMLRNNTDGTTRTFSPYEINRIFLTAIIINPHSWSELFNNTLQDLLRFVETAQQDYLAQNVFANSYNQDLIAQLKYLQSLRTDNQLEKPKMILLLPKQIKSAYEWMVFTKLLNPTIREQLYLIYKPWIINSMFDYFGLNTGNEYLTIAFSLKDLIPSIPESQQTNFLLEFISKRFHNVSKRAITEFIDQMSSTINNSLTPIINLLISENNITKLSVNKFLQYLTTESFNGKIFFHINQLILILNHADDLKTKYQVLQIIESESGSKQKQYFALNATKEILSLLTTYNDRAILIKCKALSILSDSKYLSEIASIVNNLGGLDIIFSSVHASTDEVVQQWLVYALTNIITELLEQKLNPIIKQQTTLMKCLEISSPEQAQKLQKLFPFTNAKIQQLWEQSEQKAGFFSFCNKKASSKLCYQEIINSDSLKEKHNILCKYIQNSHNQNEPFHQALIEEFGYEAFPGELIIDLRACEYL